MRDEYNQLYKSARTGSPVVIVFINSDDLHAQLNVVRDIPIFVIPADSSGSDLKSSDRS